MLNKKFEISFRIEHPKEDFEFAAKKLSINPFRIWKAGNQRESPIGTKLDGKYAQSYCCLRLEKKEGLWGADLIGLLLDELEKDKEYWSDLSLSGGKFSLVIFNVENQGGYIDEFNWQLLHRLSKLKISLGFEV